MNAAEALQNGSTTMTIVTISIALLLAVAALLTGRKRK